MDSVSVPIWAITGMGLAVFAWGLAVRVQLNRISEKLLDGHRQLMSQHETEGRRMDRLVYMHEHPAEFGFATGDTDSLEAAVRDLTHYIRWWIKTQTGVEAPPPFSGNPPDG